MAIQEDGNGLPDVVCRSGTHFLGPRRIELDGNIELRWTTTRDYSRHCYVAIGNDHLIVNVNRSVRTGELHLPQVNNRSVFG